MVPERLVVQVFTRTQAETLVRHISCIEGMEANYRPKCYIQDEHPVCKHIVFIYTKKYFNCNGIEKLLVYLLPSKLTLTFKTLKSATICYKKLCKWHHQHKDFLVELTHDEDGKYAIAIYFDIPGGKTEDVIIKLWVPKVDASVSIESCPILESTFELDSRF